LRVDPAAIVFHSHCLAGRNGDTGLDDVAPFDVERRSVFPIRRYGYRMISSSPPDECTKEWACGAGQQTSSPSVNIDIDDCRHLLRRNVRRRSVHFDFAAVENTLRFHSLHRE
jgi:hypothetical protein